MTSKLKTGLLFGSFDPVHLGHIIIADYFVQYSDIDEILIIVSPQNPFKTDKDLLDEKSRFDLLCIATENNPVIKPSDIELRMGKPSYTINTLKELSKTHPDRELILIIGSDNLDDFDKWKDYQQILELLEIYVYPRPGNPSTKFLDHPKIKLFSAPMIEISSSFIRNAIKERKNPRYLLPEKVYAEIMKKNYYK